MPAPNQLSDPYERFQGFEDGSSRFPDGYPRGKFEPLHPLFAKRGDVLTGGVAPRRTFVDLTIGECECQKGFAFMPDTLGNKGWYSNKYCIHKMRMLSSIVDNVINPVERAQLHKPYLKALSTRYNPFEVVSAFHKELRRGDFQKAWYWGLMLSNFRSMRGVIQYLLNIIYEETRDHELAEFLIKVRRNPRDHTLDKMSLAISWFCATPKKWEMPHRYAIFTGEMQGYEWLAKEYGTEPKGGVAGHGNFIPRKYRDKLLDYMLEGFRKRNVGLFQRGLKGLLKLEYGSGANEEYEHRYWLYERLYDIADQELPANHDVWRVIQVVNTKIEADYGIGYHDINAIGDAIIGENSDAGQLRGLQRSTALKRPTGAIPIGIWPAIPLYAHDNHDYRGKALIRRYSDQLKPGVVQTDLDFRWCGAYFGLAYRMQAFREHGDISEWHLVKWDRWLYKVVNSLWY